MFSEIQHTAVALGLNEVRKMGFLRCCHKGTDHWGFLGPSMISLFEHSKRIPPPTIPPTKYMCQCCWIHTDSRF